MDIRIFILQVFLTTLIASEANVEFSQIQTRIIGGKLAKEKQFPYQAGLEIHNVPNKIKMWCGGSLIGLKWILTAGHCVYMKQFYRLSDGSYEENSNIYEIVPRIDVYLGLLNKYGLEEAGQQIFQVTKEYIFKHDLFDPKRLRNDIALLKLPNEVQINEYVQLINLPKKSQNQDDITGRTLITTGWGVYNGYRSSSILRYAKLKIISYTECKKFFLVSVKNHMHICINALGKSACHGDSGGPNAYVEIDGSKTLMGISSFVSPLGCDEGEPTVLTRVHTYLDWIHEKTGIQIKN